MGEVGNGGGENTSSHFEIVYPMVGIHPFDPGEMTGRVRFGEGLYVSNERGECS